LLYHDHYHDFIHISYFSDPALNLRNTYDAEIKTISEVVSNITEKKI